jgi:hypothetical protein
MRCQADHSYHYQSAQSGTKAVGHDDIIRTNRLITTTHAAVEPKNERSAATMDIMMCFARSIMDHAGRQRRQDNGRVVARRPWGITSRGWPILTLSDDDDGLILAQ